MLEPENTKHCIFQNCFPTCLLYVAFGCSEKAQHFGAVNVPTWHQPKRWARPELAGPDGELGSCIGRLICGRHTEPGFKEISVQFRPPPTIWCHPGCHLVQCHLTSLELGVIICKGAVRESTGLQAAGERAINDKISRRVVINSSCPPTPPNPIIRLTQVKQAAL